MRTRFLPLGAAMALALGLLTAAPASATYAVSITFPGGNSEFYSPFDGPAAVTFTFDGSERDATFTLRLRPVGGSAIHSDTAFVDADNPLGSKTVQFKWPALSVSNPKTYQVAVYRGGTLLARESFLLQPRLVSITGAAPNPFLPWIDDGYKDTTNVRFALAADAAVEARVYRPKNTGKCCGALVRDDSLVNLSAGNNNWIWDGQGEGSFAGNLAKGNYFVRVEATDLNGVTRVSKPFEVTIARTYRALKTMSKPGRAFHHRGSVTSLVIGGDCLVYVNDGDLNILCQGARVSAFWRWGLRPSERIQKSSVVLLYGSSNDCPSVARRNGHSTHESSFTVTDNLTGRNVHCQIVTAKITYSYPKAS